MPLTITFPAWIEKAIADAPGFFGPFIFTSRSMVEQLKAQNDIIADLSSALLIVNIQIVGATTLPPDEGEKRLVALVNGFAA